MLFYLTTSYSNACFGPISRQNIVGGITSGFLSVYKQKVSLTCNSHHPLYIITAIEGGFYIYDNSSNRFICWRGKNVVGMNYKVIHRKGHWKMCKFQDNVESPQDAYIYLSNYGRKNTKLTLHPKKSWGCMPKVSVVKNFLKYPSEKCDCEKTHELFCRTRLKNMNELSKVCKKDVKELCN
ncbi:hypothetical protein GWI33_004456 [Rhynchophorus ferrugineus]|uniref:Uncharacterized protein n=1 Tax=Rhynchophorus ferrugineus TaxID=354439 RepID=A0A834MGS8_RHYFE|nr:hypothetical protein GWI33_004456 [Rhynchophorus ferrugineus]